MSQALSELSRRAIQRAVPQGIERCFDPHAAGDLEATLELRITDATGARGARYEITIAGGRCTVQRRPAPSATLRVAIAADDAVRLLARRVPWPTLLAERRLTLSGDPFLAIRFPMLFGFARARPATPDHR
jgi:hypothetical protein